MKNILLHAVLWFALIIFTGCGAAPDATCFSYEKTDGGWMVTSVNVNTENIVIPEEYNGAPVVSIKDSAFYRNETLRHLTIPSSVQNVGSYAFSDCTHLTEVTFEGGGNCVISDSAFEGCMRLLKVSFNGSVSTVGDNAFKNCTSLTILTFGNE